jgi:predicted RNA-binding Zn ribbon-like protein
MVFDHDTELSLAFVVALVNGEGRDGEELRDVDDLARLLRAHAWTGRHDRTEAELRAVRALRPVLRGLWSADEDGVVETVNRLLRESDAVPQLIRHDGHPYHIHAVPQDAPLATRMAADAAMAFVAVVREGELGRLRSCGYPGCGNVVVDLSKNRSKRFCEAGCGNRAAVEAYRARKAAARG